MADIAELGYKVDSSGLVEGTKALDENAAAAAKTGAAAERLEKEYQALARTADKVGVSLDGAIKDDGRFSRIAKGAVEYAESMRGANLSERALAEAAREATSAYDSRAAVMARAGTEQERLATRAKALQEAEARATNQARDAARATQAQELNLKKLIGQIDPTVAALDRLADMEDRLAKARDLGLIKPQVFQQYQAQLDATRAKTLGAAQGTGTLAGQFGQLNLRSVEAQQSVVTLLRALATGDFAQAQSSITSLTARTGALGGMLTMTGLAVGGTVAGIAALTAVAVTGYMELRQLEGQLTATGDAAGFNADQLMLLRAQLGEAKGNYTDAGAAIAQLVEQGNASGQTLQLIASAAMNLSDLTGKSISSTVNEVESLATGGADALVKLNDRYNFLTLEVYQHIEAVREQRGDYAATEAAVEQLEGVIRQRADGMAESAGIVERAWKGALAAFNDTVEGVKQVGRSDLTSQLERAKEDLAYFQELQRSPLPGDRSRGSNGVEEMRARIAQLGQWKSELADGAAILGQVRQYDRDAVTAERELQRERSAADEALKGRLAGLDREASKRQAINKIIEIYNKLDDNDPRHFDGSMQKLIAQANSQVDKQFNKREGVGKKNADDGSAQSFLANIQRQITANQQLAESGDKVTASDRLVIQARQLLADKTNTMTAATRSLLQALIPQLEASDKAATLEKQRQRDLAASAALTERLAQLEKLRTEQANVDLMGIGRGANATEMLNRQLEIQRQYLQEREKLDKAQRDKDTALSDEAYRSEQDKLQASLSRSLDIERDYQQRRAAMLADWRTGFNRVWEDYIFAAGNASEQSASLLSNGLSRAEDAFVKFVQTGKLSFKDLANSIIADLARIAAKQAIMGLVNMFASAWGGGASGVSSTFSAQSFGNNTGWLNEGVNFAGGRASGGPVRGSSLYEVGEGGRPELFDDGRGKTYLIPGNNGQVIPAATPSTSAGGSAAPAQLSVVVHIASDGSTEADANTPQMKQFGEELGRFVEAKYRALQEKDMRPGGPLHAMGAGR